jgi:membrane associated rhomboid family serine protease
MSQHTIREEIRGVIVFVGSMWVVFVLDWLLGGRISNWGLVPRTLVGLVGIPLTPFLHADLGHLLSNTVPLVILLALMAGSRTQTWQTVAALIGFGGGILWLIGRSQRHIGASVLVYSLIAFLIVAGLREKRFVPLLIALFVGFLYGSTLIFGVLPSVDSRISWEGHLSGALAGGALAGGAQAFKRQPANSPV